MMNDADDDDDDDIIGLQMNVWTSIFAAFPDSDHCDTALTLQTRT